MTTYHASQQRPRPRWAFSRLTRAVAGIGAVGLICALGTGSAVATPAAALRGVAVQAVAVQAVASSPSARTYPGPDLATETVTAPVLGAGKAGAIPGQYIVVLKDRSGLGAARLPAGSGSAGSAGPAGPGAGTSAARQLSSAGRVSAAAARGGELGATVENQYTDVLQGYSARLSATALAKVRADPDVEYVQANQRYTTTAITAGTEQTPPWGLDRIDQRNLPLKNKYFFTGTGAGVTAYVVDTGIRSSHGEFTTDSDGNTVPTRVTGGVCKIPVDDDGTIGCDKYGTGSCTDKADHTGESGHGTHVAGTLGGTNVGVAKQVSLVSVRVLGCDGSSTSAAVAAGLDWIVKDHTTGPAVANLSLSNNGDGPDTVVEAAVRRVIADGVTVVVAAGNGLPNKHKEYVGASACSFSPSDVRAAIVVGASAITDKRAPFSNYGSCVDLYAPGVDVESSWDTSDTALADASGTSMATPHVAGAVALYLERHPTASPATVQKAIVTAATASKVTNVSKAWPRRLLFALQPVTKPTATSTAGEITSGTALLSGSTICSPNALYCLTQRAGDGVLVLQKPGDRTIWSAGTGGAWTRMNGTGNLASYDQYNRPVWSTRTSGVGASTLYVQDTGDLALINNATGAREWTSASTQTTAPVQSGLGKSTLAGGRALYRGGSTLVSPNGTFSLALRSDGELVLSKHGTGTIWHTKAEDDDWLTVRTDGNLELVRSDGTVVWKTGGDQGLARLILKNSGNLALTRISDSKILWSTRTSGA